MYPAIRYWTHTYHYYTVYHQESLKAGLATRAIKFTGAREWHIRDSNVVWSNLENSISTRLLRSPKASSSKSEITRFQFKKLVPKGYKVEYVQAVSKDEILVTAQTHRTKRDSETIPSQKLILISLSGKKKWVADIENSSTRPAIGRTSLYTITEPMASAFTDTGRSLSLIKLSLSTGSTEMDKALPISGRLSGIQPAIILSEEYLVLTLTQSCAMRRQTPLSAGGHHIICTSTGSLLYSHANKHGTIDVAATPSITLNGVWAYGLPHTRLTQQNPFDKSWVTHEIRLPPCISPEPNKTVQRGFEGDRSLFSHLIHSRPSECLPSGRSEPHFFMRRTSKFGVSRAFTDSEVLGGTTRPTEVSYTTSMPSFVTLPDGDGGRREFEIKLPLSDVSGQYYGAFFGFVDGYIAYHNRGEELLLLIDFRPNW